MVELEILGVVNVVPVPSDVPPISVEYQLMIPAEAVAPNMTVPEPHLLPAEIPVMVGLIMVTFAPLSLPVTEGAEETTLKR